MDDVTTLSRPTATPSRRGRRPAFVQRYWAFLSYSHKDAATADWLHSAIECFKVPKRLVGRGTPYGLVPARLAPVFRDRHDLAAGDDLHEDIQQALAASRFLVVICSPAAVASRWVDREIQLFRKLRPDGEVFAAVVDGEPWASEMPGREAEECFPLCLRQGCDEHGEPNGERAEPIAADLRPSRDGRQLGLQKLVAGMLDVGLDELVQREAQRRHRHMLAVAGGSFAGMVVAAGLAIAAVQARDEARDQRREAEGLVGFMLGDLRDKLEPIGRLDALDAVGARALAYYEKQDEGSLSDVALAQQSRALTLMGEIASQRGDLGGAMRRYAEAMRGTEEMLRRSPDDPQRLFDHAQNVFWVGDIALRRGQTGRAEALLREYKRLAERMVALDPGNEKWHLERKYADTNLGVMLLEQRRFGDAVSMFQEALASGEALLARAPSKPDHVSGRIESLSWLAQALEFDGRLDDALAQRQRQLRLLEPLIATPNSGADYRRQAMVAHRVTGRLLASRGQIDQAVRHVQMAVTLGEQLMRSDPQNAVWAGWAALAYLDKAELLLARGDAAQARRYAQLGCDISGRLAQRDESSEDWRADLPRDCLTATVQIALAQGFTAEAMERAQRLRSLGATELRRTGKSDARMIVARAETLAGLIHLAEGDRREAVSAFRRALAVWPPPPMQPSWLAWRVVALAGAGERTQAGELARELQALGYRHPTYGRSRALVGL